MYKRALVIGLVVSLLLVVTCVNAQVLTVSTDKDEYVPGERVIISGTALPGVNVSLRVEDLSGAVVWEGRAETAIDGNYTASFVLRENSPLGLYRVYAAFGNLTATANFTVVAPFLEVECLGLDVSALKAYPGQSILVKASLRNAGNTNGTFYVYAESSLFGEVSNGTVIEAGEVVDVNLVLKVPLNASPGSYPVDTKLAVFWLNGTLANTKTLETFNVEVLPTDIEVTFVFRFPTGTPLSGYTVLLDGVPVGYTDENGELRLKLVANKVYKVGVSREVEELEVSYEKSLWLDLGGPSEVLVEVVPSNLCAITDLVLEPNKIEVNGVFDVLTKFTVAPYSSESSFEVKVYTDWGEEATIYSGEVTTVESFTTSYSLVAPGKAGVYSVKVLLNVDGKTCKATEKLEVRRTKEGCVKVIARYLDGSPAAKAMVRVGGYTNITNDMGVGVLCGLREGKYHISVQDRLGVYYGEVKDFEVVPFTTRSVVVYLEPKEPCIALTRSKERITLPRFDNWTLTATLKFRRCMVKTPLVFVLRMENGEILEVTEKLEKLVYDAELPVNFTVPFKVTSGLSPGERYKATLIVKDSEGAEIASFEVYEIYVKDNILDVVRSPGVTKDPVLFLLYVFTLIDIGMVVLLTLLYGGVKDWPVLKTIAKVMANVKYPEKLALLSAAALIYVYVTYEATNIVINYSFFDSFIKGRYVSLVALLVIFALSSWGVTRYAKTALKPLIGGLTSVKRVKRSKGQNT